MTLRKNGSGIYEGDYRVKGIPRLHLSLGTKKAGEARARHEAVRLLFRQRRVEMIAQLRSRVLTVDRVAAMVAAGEPMTPIAAAAVEPDVPARSPWGTVAEARDRYLAWLDANPKKSRGTYDNARAQLRRFAAFSWNGRTVGDLPLEAVTSAVVQAYQQALLEAKTPANTVTSYMTRVGALWRWAANQEARLAREERRDPRPLYSPADPEMTFRKTTARDRYLDQGEADRLLAATPEPLLAMVCLALLAGLRLGEAQHLTPRDIDLEIGILTVREHAKPDGSRWTPKTKRSARSVPIADGLRPVLERHLAKYASEAWLTPRYDAAWPIHEKVFQEHFRKIVHRAEMSSGRKAPADVSYHTLRHTFASWLVMRGVDLYTVAQLLGDTLATVENTYSHLSPDHKRQAIARLQGAVTIPAEG